MGCDYYIVKALEITFKEEKYPLLIELERDYGYFGDFDYILDNDDPDYEEKFEELKRERLKPGRLPIVIFEEDAFMNEKLDQKYRLTIEEELFLNKRSWAEVLKIEKIEYRYERD